MMRMQALSQSGLSGLAWEPATLCFLRWAQGLARDSFWVASCFAGHQITLVRLVMYGLPGEVLLDTTRLVRLRDGRAGQGWRGWHESRFPKRSLAATLQH